MSYVKDYLLSLKRGENKSAREYLWTLAARLRRFWTCGFLGFVSACFFLLLLQRDATNTFRVGDGAEWVVKVV